MFFKDKITELLNKIRLWSKTISEIDLLKCFQIFELEAEFNFFENIKLNIFVCFSNIFKKN